MGFLTNRKVKIQTYTNTLHSIRQSLDLVSFFSFVEDNIDNGSYKTLLEKKYSNFFLQGMKYDLIQILTSQGDGIFSYTASTLLDI
jgi:hypothetical protein